MDIIDIILGAKLGRGSGSPAQNVRITNVTMTEDFKLQITFSDGYVYTSTQSVRGTDGRGIVSWVLTETDEGKDVYTVTYTDDTTTIVTVQNSKYWHDQAEVVYNNTRTLLLNTIVVHTDSTTTEAVLTPDYGVRYIYGELQSLTLVSVPAEGTVDILFDSGSTATVLALPQTGILLPEWFDPTDLQANTRYELNFADGNLLVSCWPLS